MIIRVFHGHNHALDSKLFFISLLRSLTACSETIGAEKKRGSITAIEHLFSGKENLARHGGAHCFCTSRVPKSLCQESSCVFSQSFWEKQVWIFSGSHSQRALKCISLLFKCWSCIQIWMHLSGPFLALYSLQSTSKSALFHLSRRQVMAFSTSYVDIHTYIHTHIIHHIYICICCAQFFCQYVFLLW